MFTNNIISMGGTPYQIMIILICKLPLPVVAR